MVPRLVANFIHISNISLHPLNKNPIPIRSTTLPTPTTAGRELYKSNIASTILSAELADAQRARIKTAPRPEEASPKVTRPSEHCSSADPLQFARLPKQRGRGDPATPWGSELTSTRSSSGSIIFETNAERPQQSVTFCGRLKALQVF